MTDASTLNAAFHIALSELMRAVDEGKGCQHCATLTVAYRLRNGAGPGGLSRAGTASGFEPLPSNGGRA